MDKVEQYRQLVQELMLDRASWRNPDDPVKSEVIFDTQRDRYQLVHVGWRNSSTRIYGCIIHVDIQGEKIWVQHDGTEEAIANRLIERGVPKKDIVLAYHSPQMRQYTEFAIG
ncbi:MAG: XisI protein [Cyanobacteria bacterium P01_E01_bin.42]